MVFKKIILFFSKELKKYRCKSIAHNNDGVFAELEDDSGQNLYTRAPKKLNTEYTYDVKLVSFLGYPFFIYLNPKKRSK